MLPIHHTFAPLADSAQRGLALWRLLQPWRYRDGKDSRSLEQALAERFGGEAIAFSSGRESLLAYLRSLKPASGEEVIVQGYTCVVVPNTIHAAGMITVYADIGHDTLNLDLAAVEAAITPKTRAVICQHTFGIPADTKRLREICDRHSILLIEDCAHILPDRNGPDTIGRLGDAMLLSFGRDKAISGISGGAIITRNKELAASLHDLQSSATPESSGKIFTLLLYPLLYGIAKPLYGIGIGKALLALAAKAHLLVPILSRNEKKGLMPGTLHQMPGACAALALQQLNKLETINDHRRMLTNLYTEHALQAKWPLLRSIAESYKLKAESSSILPLQKFPLFVTEADAIRNILKDENIHLADGWTGCVVCPESVNDTDAGYTNGTVPDAEAACQQILSLPTHPGMTAAQAKRLVTLLDPLLTS